MEGFWSGGPGVGILVEGSWWRGPGVGVLV